jgi:hypothetical protein
MPGSQPENPGSLSNADKLVTDVFAFALYFLCFDPMLNWQMRHPGASAVLLMGLNIAAMWFGVFSFFSVYSDGGGLGRLVNSLSGFERAALGLSAFISCFAFLWWLVPFAAVNAMGVRETGIWLGALIYFLVFLATVAGSIQDPRGIELQKRSIFQWSSSIVISVFFFFAYVFLIMTLQQRPPAFLGAKVLGIICLVVFYLPLRFFLLLRPPAARSEYVLFLLVFGYLLYELSAKT